MSKPTIAAIIVGIDGWQKFTLPLIESLEQHEPDIKICVIDNASEEPYPQDYTQEGASFRFREPAKSCIIRSSHRMCYSKAINKGAYFVRRKYWWESDAMAVIAPKPGEHDPDWYIVLSNDVLCTGPFADILASYDGGDLVGPLMKDELGFAYLEGWCVCVSARAWQPWDERFLGSDYEDVAYSTAARQRGVGLVEDKSLPFVHLDQRQRYHVVDDFAGKNAHNRALFLREYAAVTA